MKNLKAILIIIFVIFIKCSAKRYVKQQVAASAQEMVNGKQFSHVYQLMDGVCRELWSIDGQTVDKTTYEEAILDAEREERRREREKEYTEKMDNLAVQQRMRRTLLKKLLAASVNHVQQLQEQLSDYSLTQFIAYGDQTFTKDLYQNFIEEKIPYARGVLKNEELSLTELQEIVNLWEKYEKCMKKLVQETIEVTIQQCNDTVLLKRILELL